jgi:hypothetical protein
MVVARPADSETDSSENRIRMARVLRDINSYSFGNQADIKIRLSDSLAEEALIIRQSGVDLPG